MTFNYSGYKLHFIQKEPCRDQSAHLFTHVYKFFSPVTKYNYVLRADYHREDVFAIKFYCKKDKYSDYKYSTLVNRGDAGNILMTCAKAVPLLLRDYPTASFGFVSSRTIDTRSAKVESYYNNQRFRIYKYMIALKFGTQTFAHYEYKEISSYLLVNKLQPDVDSREKQIVKMFSETYTVLPDLI